MRTTKGERQRRAQQARCETLQLKRPRASGSSPIRAAGIPIRQVARLHRRAGLGAWRRGGRRYKFQRVLLSCLLHFTVSTLDLSSRAPETYGPIVHLARASSYFAHLVNIPELWSTVPEYAGNPPSAHPRLKGPFLATAWPACSIFRLCSDPYATPSILPSTGSSTAHAASPTARISYWRG